jgi:SH3 domain-containing YSC84-like protein 1
MIRNLTFFLLAALLPTALLAETADKQRLEDAATVLDEIMASPDGGIPQNLLDKAHCIVVIPDLKKGAFIFGGRYGKGYISCRLPSTGAWSAPATVRVEGGSFGFQLGASETDVVLLVMNRRGADRLMQTKFTLGGSAEVAAGPVGRSASAETDALMKAEILSYSRSRGIFAGAALQGSTLRADLDDNKAMYRYRLTTDEIVRDPDIKPTQAGEKLQSTLTKYSSKETS